MNNTNLDSEKIELTLPVNAAYVSAARLTAASIANRMNFHIDEIEDIKAAVSEACIIILKLAPVRYDGVTYFKIEFFLKENLLEIIISTTTSLTTQDLDEEMGYVMIQALMDEVRPNSENGFELVMQKLHKANNLAEGTL